MKLKFWLVNILKKFYGRMKTPRIISKPTKEKSGAFKVRGILVLYVAVIISGLLNYP